VVAAGLALDKHIDAWITVGPENLKVNPAGLQDTAAHADRHIYPKPRRTASNPLVVDRQVLQDLTVAPSQDPQVPTQQRREAEAEATCNASTPGPPRPIPSGS